MSGLDTSAFDSIAQAKALVGKRGACTMTGMAAIWRESGAKKAGLSMAQLLSALEAEGCEVDMVKGVCSCPPAHRQEGDTPAPVLMWAPPVVPWTKDAETGEDVVHVPDVCGPLAWSFLHSWAQNVSEWMCPNCGAFAEAAAIALHDVVNVKLGRPVQDVDNLRRVTEYFLRASRAAGGGAGAPEHEQTLIGRLVDAAVTGFGIAGGFYAFTRAREMATAPADAGQELGGDPDDDPVWGTKPHLSAQALKLDVSGEGEFLRERIADPASFDGASLRTITTGKHRRIVGCPVGSYNEGACQVGMQTQAVLHPRSEEIRLVREAGRRDIPIVIEGGMDPEQLVDEVGRIADEVLGAHVSA